jgi:NAD+ kinase
MQARTIGVVIHPRREITTAFDTLSAWCAGHGARLVQLFGAEKGRAVADPGEPGESDLVVALGGDGTTLAAVHAAGDEPVLGVACGSLGALTATTGDNLAAALDRVAAGDWMPRPLPALAVDAGRETPHAAVNDMVVVREGAGQVTAEVSVDGQLFIRFAGDGLVIATQLGSSAYTLAAGGPVLAPGGTGLVFTPLAPHGGCCPPLVAGPEARLELEVDPGHGGARLEVDGRIQERLQPFEPRVLAVTLRPAYATLVSFAGEEPMLAGLRRRRVLMDSPRMLARDDRAARV